MFQRNVLPPSSVFLNLVQMDAKVIGRRKSVNYTGRLQRFWPVQGSDCPKLLQPSYLINTSPPSSHFGIHLNQIQSAWRWRKNIPPKRQKKLIVCDVIIRRLSFGFSMFFLKYNMGGFHCKSLGNSNLG
jgi:hypothetical protein